MGTGFITTMTRQVSIAAEGCLWKAAAPVGAGRQCYSCAAARDGSALYYSRVLSNTVSGYDYEIRVARPENGPSQPLGRVAGSRVPAGAINFQPVLSRDGKWLAMPLMDGSTANLYALSTEGRGWRKLTDFSPRSVVMARRVDWSKDGKSIYASFAEVDSDIVMLQGLKP
jgi:Tol biopolymer transport system component